MQNAPLLDPLALAYLANTLLLLFAIASPLLCLLALWQLRQHSMQGIELVLWVLIILLIPILGATAAFITLNRNRTPNLHSA